MSTTPDNGAHTNGAAATKPTTQITPYDGDGDLLWNTAGFEHVQRIARIFVGSELIPPHMRKLENVVIALTMARRLGEDPLIVMQSMHVVKGKPGWAAQYMIGRVNRSGVFKGRINWRETGSGKALEVTAYATLLDTGEQVEFCASMEMAEAEGWTANPKYKSMPKLMLRYRSAVFLVRLYCPEVMLGIPTVEEMEDTAAAEPPAPKPARTGRAALGIDKGNAIDAEVVETSPAETPEVDAGAVAAAEQEAAEVRAKEEAAALEAAKAAALAAIDVPALAGEVRQLEIEASSGTVEKARGDLGIKMSTPAAKIAPELLVQLAARLREARGGSK